MTRNEIQLSRGRLRPLFLRYALPGVMAMLFLALQAIADGFIVGRLIGASALAAVNIAVPAYTLVSAVALIIGVGTQAQMGLHTGAGNYVQAKCALRSGITGLTVFAVAGTVFINVFADELARFLGANDELAELSVGYIHGVMPWLVGLAGFFLCDYLLKALGHPRTAMTVMVGTILLNVVLSVVFVTRHDMQTFGAGLGTGISFTLGGLTSGSLFAWHLRHNQPLHEARSRFSWRTLGRILYNGSSEGMAEIAVGITTFLFNITLMRYAGKEGVAAFTLINSLMFIGISAILGVSNGVIPIVSYNYGGGLMMRVAGTVGLAVKSNLICGMVFMVLLWVLGEPIVSLFIDPTERQVIELTVRGARIASLSFLFAGVNIFAASFFTAIDKAGLSLLVAALRGLVLLVAGILILPPLAGVDGIWLTLPLADALTVIVVIGLARTWRRKLAKG